MADRNEHGFRIFGEGKNSHQYGEWRVDESSLAFCGAHCWVSCVVTEQDVKDGCRRKVGDDYSLHLDVEGAKRLIESLQAFIAAADDGQLMEPSDGA